MVPLQRSSRLAPRSATEREDAAEVPGVEEFTGDDSWVWFIGARSAQQWSTMLQNSDRTRWSPFNWELGDRSSKVVAGMPQADNGEDGEARGLASQIGWRRSGCQSAP